MRNAGFICVFSILPVSAVMGADFSKETINEGTTTQITESAISTQDKSNIISPTVTNPGEGGTTTMRC